MKEFDSYIIYGCHFPTKFGLLVENKIEKLNNNLRANYGIEILKLNVPTKEIEKKLFVKNQYFVSIILNIGERNFLRNNIFFENNKLKQKIIDKVVLFKKFMKKFELEVDPIFLSIPIVREL